MPSETTPPAAAPAAPAPAAKPAATAPAPKIAVRVVQQAVSYGGIAYLKNQVFSCTADEAKAFGAFVVPVKPAAVEASK